MSLQMLHSGSGDGVLPAPTLAPQSPAGAVAWRPLQIAAVSVARKPSMTSGPRRCAVTWRRG